MEERMLIKNRKRVVCRGMLSLVFVFALSALAALSPLVRAEESPKYTWRDITIPGQGNISESRVSLDSSKLFVLRKNLSGIGANLLVSADDGASWSTFAAPEGANGLLVSSDGSRLVVKGKHGENAIYVSTDGGRTWTKRNQFVADTARVLMSPDGSTLAMCGSVTAHTDPMSVSTDGGNTWVPKGGECPDYVFNGGKMTRRNSDRTLRQSTDYGMTWSIVRRFADRTSFSPNGKSVFDGYYTSVDGGANWVMLPEYPINDIRNVVLSGISNDGKKIFATFDGTPAVPVVVTTDGGETWQKWGDEVVSSAASISMSADGHKILAVSPDNNIYRLATLPTPPPVTPGGAGSGASGAAAPSTSSSSSGISTATTSSSSTFNKKPEKPSRILAETGNSVWVVGGLAVVAVAAGVLVLRKRL
jgi:hypothetical protein